MKLWLLTGIRALDHVVEIMCNPAAMEVLTRILSLASIKDLFKFLVKYQEDAKDKHAITKYQLAAFTSLYGMDVNTVLGGIGLGHSLGYALGSPYLIPHDIISCLTLGKMVKLKAANDPKDTRQITRILLWCGVGEESGG